MAGGSRYARNTSVSVDRSQAQIKLILRKYGATQTVIGEDDDLNAVLVMFRFEERMYKVQLQLPDPDDEGFRYGPSGSRQRTDIQTEKAYDQEVRHLWRSLGLYIHATLEAVEAEIISVQEAFFTYLMLPDGRTMGQVAEPQIAKAYKTGKMPKLSFGLFPALPPAGGELVED